MVIRSVEPGDAKELMDYVNELVEEEVPILKDRKVELGKEQEYVAEVLAKVAKGTMVYIVVEDGETIAGAAQVEVDKFRASHVGTFGVSLRSKYRGDGIGTALSVVTIEQAMEKLGVELMVLDVFANNDPGLGLYKKIGFAECGKIPGGVKYKGKKVDRLMMYKELTE